jgi:glutathione S-transferase
VDVAGIGYHPTREERMDLTLYTAPGSRGLVCEWLLEELGLVHDKVVVDLGAGEHKSPGHLRIHPLGAVPALVVEGLPIMETLAICLFLSEHDTRQRLAPVPTGAKRAKWLQWMVYSVTTLESAIVPVFSRAMLLPRADRRSAATQTEQQRFSALLAPLEQPMQRGSVLETGFGAVDLCLSCRLLWAEQVGLLPDPDATARVYLAHHLERPAYARVVDESS